MNLLNRMMSYENSNKKLNIDGTEKVCDCENCISKTIKSQNFNNFFTKLENYHLMCKEKEILNIINIKYWYKDAKTKTFIWRALKLHGNKYDYSYVTYINNKNNIDIICKKHNYKFSQTPNNHLQGHGCSKCAYEYKAERQKLTLEEFIIRAKEIHGNKYDYSNSKYIDIRTDVEIICPIHGSFWQTPKDHLDGCGCNKCANEYRSKCNKLTLEEFIIRAKEIHGNKYNYLNSIYINYNTDIEIICSKHGSFWQTPHAHLSGEGCPFCAIEKLAKQRRLTLNEVIRRSNEKHGDGRYDYSESEYINSQTPMKIICPKHGAFWQVPIYHMLGSGCPICNESKGEYKIRIFLTKNNISFEKEKRFDDCKYKYTLPFDFYIPKYNLCIEFDGIQHYVPTDFSSKMTNLQKLENLKLVQLRDKIKTDYCKSHNINLLRIKYDEDVEEKLIECFQNIE